MKKFESMKYVEMVIEKANCHPETKAYLTSALKNEYLSKEKELDKHYHFLLMAEAIKKIEQKKTQNE